MSEPRNTPADLSSASEDSSKGWLGTNLDALNASGFDSSSLLSQSRHVRRVSGMLQVAASDGRWLRVHGRVPHREAAQIVAASMKNWHGASLPKTAIVIGLGLGHLLDALEQCCPNIRVVALEADAAVIRECLSERDLRSWLSSGRLHFLVGPDYKGASEAWRLLDLARVEPLLVVHPILTVAFPDLLARGREIARRITFDAQANQEARRRFAGPYLLNTLRNLARVAEEADVCGLLKAFTDVPAIVIGAGPSLDEQLQTLRSVQSHAVLVASDTALRPLLQAGISPHLVVALDPGKVNARHLMGLPTSDETWLVAEPSIDPLAWPQFSGRTFTFRVADNHPWPWLRSIGIDRGHLRAWGSVVTSAFDLALRAGCDPIVFVGVDLAFTHHRPYCRGTTFEQDWTTAVACGDELPDIWSRALSRYSSLEKLDSSGRSIPTAPHLVAVRDWLKQTIPAVRPRCFNGTPHGLLHGTPIECASLRTLALGWPAATDLRSRLRKAWSSARHRQATSALFEAHVDERAPMNQWADIDGAPSTRSELLTILAGESTQMDSTRGDAPFEEISRSPVTQLSSPETAGVVRAILSGGNTPPWAATATWQADRSGERCLRLNDLLAAILGAAGPVATGLDSNVLSAVSDVGAVPPSVLFRWAEPFRTLIHQLESKAAASWVVLRDVRSHVQRLLITSGGLELIDVRWADVLARLSVARLWAHTVGASTGGTTPSASTHVLDRLWATSIHTSSIPASDAISQAVMAIRLPTAGARCSSALEWRMSLEDAAVALAGLVRRHDDAANVCEAANRLVLSPGADSKMQLSWSVAPSNMHRSAPALHSSSGHWFRPISLSDRGLPPCHAIARLHDGAAVLTPANALHSFAVTSRGAFRRLHKWPRPINGEVPWGTNGGAVAWRGYSPNWILLRPEANDEILVEHVPFAAHRASVAQDGSVVWASHEGGLWRWVPGGSARRLVSTSPLVGIRLIEGGIRIDYGRGHSAPAWSVNPPYSWVWRQHSGVLTPLVADPEGPCWSHSEFEGWTAEAFPWSHLIRIRNPDGKAVDIACGAPDALAWAGTSLVVSNKHGEVLLFEDLQQRLADAGIAGVDPSLGYNRDTV